jgi:hypothetical protein
MCFKSESKPNKFLINKFIHPPSRPLALSPSCPLVLSLPLRGTASLRSLPPALLLLPPAAYFL